MATYAPTFPTAGFATLTTANTLDYYAGDPNIQDAINRRMQKEVLQKTFFTQFYDMGGYDMDVMVRRIEDIMGGQPTMTVTSDAVYKMYKDLTAYEGWDSKAAAADKKILGYATKPLEFKGLSELT